MECTLKTLGISLCSSGAVGTLVRAAANMRRGDSLQLLKELGFFLLRWFVLSAIKAWWLSGQRVRLPISRRGFVSCFHCIFISFFLRGHVTKVRLRAPVPNVFSVAEWLALYVASDGVETRLRFAVQIRSAFKCRGQPVKTREGVLGIWPDG